jgi:hypothetical protein
MMYNEEARSQLQFMRRTCSEKSYTVRLLQHLSLSLSLSLSLPLPVSLKAIV